MTVFDGLPTLRSPIAIVAFEGWNDAADAATSAIEHLETVWTAKPLAAIDPDEYYDFQVNRPTITSPTTGERHIEWPTTRLSSCSPDGLDRDIVLVRGLEPNMRWRRFCDEVLELLHALEVESVVMLGALLADVPHSRPFPVNRNSADQPTGDQTTGERSRYEGPTGITGVMQEACVKADLTTTSYWVQVPHYVAQPPCPKATVALLNRLEDALSVTIPTGDLPESAQSWEATVNELAGQDAEMAEYVRSLEERDGEAMAQTSGEELAAEFEQYLRNRGHRGPSGPGSSSTGT